VITRRQPHKRRDLVGRPPKFAEPSRPVTVTLPERTLRNLAMLHPDRAHAIAQASDFVVQSNGKAPPIEILEVAPGIAVILVAAIPSLKKIPWLKLIKIYPTCHLLTVVPGTSIESIEVAILDVIDDLGPNEESERATLMALLGQIRQRRRDREITKAEILFVHPHRRRSR
jgi:hypothetical protein